MKAPKKPQTTDLWSGKNPPAKDVDAFIEGSPKEARPKLRELRRIIRALAPGAEEVISYQMPTFRLNGNLVHFAAFKTHIGFYPTPSGIEAFKKENVLPEMVQVGNEITPGMLWPDGRVGGEFENDAQWEKFTSLLKAGIAGVHQGAGDSNVIIMLHIDQGGKKSVTKWFFDNINKRQVPYDIIGVSYYPWWHGKIEDLNDNLNYIAAELKKDVIVVETGYPYATNDRMKPSENQQFPLTPQGQYDLLYTVTKTVLSTPGNHGCGVFYWFPESVPLPGRGRMGGGLGLFDPNGNVLPGAKAFSDAVKKEMKPGK